MRNFEKLSRDEMKIVVGGNEKVCVPSQCLVDVFGMPYPVLGVCAISPADGCSCLYNDQYYAHLDCYVG